MGCPVHVWLPLMAGLAPVGRIARDRLRVMRARRSTGAGAAQAPEIRRWAPVQPHGRGDSAGSRSAPD